MTEGRAILAELIAKGVSTDILLAVSQLITDAKFINARRDRDAERKRNYRERVRGRPRMSQDVPGQPPPSPSHTLPLPSPSDISPPKVVGDISAAMPKSTRKKPRRTLPYGWQPLLAKEEKRELERFCDHARANGRVCADWDAAWRNWLSSPHRKSIPANGQGEHKPQISYAESWQLRARAQLAEREAIEREREKQP